MERDYYSTLGVSRFVSQQALKRAYRARIRKVHPDLNPTDIIAADRARKVIEAYGVLRDPESRRRYDKMRSWPAERAAIPVYAYDAPCPQWVTQFFALVVFFAVAAALFCVVMTSVTDSTPVFRPSLAVLDTRPSSAAPALSIEKFRREGRTMSFRTDCREAQDPSPRTML